MNGRLFIVSAPSGAGKTTLVKKVVELVEPLQRVITYTSRVMREGEEHGKDYFFIDESEFKQKIQEGFFIEWSTAYGCYYGSPQTILKDVLTGQFYIMILDQNGAQEIIKCYPEAILIWISPPSIKELEMRLKKRGSEKSEDRRKRLILARKEIAKEEEGIMYHCRIVNSCLKTALKELKKVIESKLI